MPYQKTLGSTFSLCLFSAGLLILAFPKVEIWILSWIGLVPLMFALDGQSRGKAFGLAYFSGFLFFLGTLYWLVHVSGLGLTLLALYLALYFGLFGWGYAHFQNRKPIFKLFLIPSVWVVCEFIRAHFLSGFSWSSLALSQYKNLWVIQIADVTGMFGVSFLIVAVNFALKELLERSKECSRLIVITVTLLVFVLGYGMFRLNQSGEMTSMRVAVVQGNIAQDQKWNPESWLLILNRHFTLSRQAAARNPDLIIWPETSVPGFFNEDGFALGTMKKFAREINTPVLIGAVVKENQKYYNSAVLLSYQGDTLKRYDKIHLVPFGEYIPFRKTLPFLAHVAPIADFTAGDQHTIFPMNFATLICFEDTVPHLVRRFVANGAEALINITNDAWFQDTAEPFMHLQSSVFRAIENRRSVVRAANTGVSGFIDSTGRMMNNVNEKGKETYVRGYAVAEVELHSQKSFYTKFGDIFTYLCIGCILLAIRKQFYEST